MKFVIVRFAPGSGGKFLSTLLQLSPSINPWDSQIHSNQVVEWFKNHFTEDFVNWLKIEPEVPYQTNFVSNRFNRGDNINTQEALELLSDDQIFQKHWNNDKKICLISNKSRVPNWIQGQCQIVNLIIDDVQSKKWTSRCRLNKQFLKHGDQWIIKQDHPDFCSSTRSLLAKQFNNPTTFSGTTVDFLRQYIVNDPLIKIFTNKAAVLADESNQYEQQYFVQLSQLINPKYTSMAIENICNQLDIQCPDLNLVDILAQHYYQIHHTIFSK